jgi:phytanoyl-CoA hydroxylase
MPAITAAEQERFRRDGFLLLDGFVAGRACDRLRARAAELIEAFQPGALRSIFTTDEQARHTDDYFLDSAGAVRFFFEEHAVGERGELLCDKALAINKIGHALHDLDPEFDRFSRTRELAELYGDLGVLDPLLMQSMYICKQPLIGGEVACHQDSTFLHTEPERLIGLWFALEDATVDNGCLWAIPGGHREGLKRRFLREGRRTRFVELDERPFELSRLVPLEAKKGALIVLDGLSPHLSRQNRSPRSRHAYTLHAVPASARYPTTNWLQRETPARGF